MLWTASSRPHGALRPPLPHTPQKGPTPCRRSCSRSQCPRRLRSSTCSRQNSHAEAHALAAHAAMGSYTLAAAQNGMPALPQLHTKSALHSRRNSSDGGASALRLAIHAS